MERVLTEPHAYEDSIDEEDQFMTFLPYWWLIDNTDKNVLLWQVSLQQKPLT